MSRRTARRAARSGHIGLHTLWCATFSVSLVGLAMLTDPAPVAAGTTPAWTTTVSPVPANSNAGNISELIATSCYSVGNCSSVGAYDVGAGSYAYVVSETGGTSSATELPPLPNNAATPFYIPTSIDCTGPGSCVVVGFYQDTSANEQAFASVESGTSWTSTELPVPPAASNPRAGLFDLACPSAGSCVASGSYRDTTSGTRGLIETLSGGVWNATEAPLPTNAAANPQVDMFTVSCGATGSCVTGGSYQDGSANTHAFIDQLSGGTWTSTQAPVPSNSAANAFGFLLGSSCPVAGWCMLVGFYEDAAGNEHALGETLSGGTITPSDGPVPADAVTSGTSPSPGAAFYSVSCPAVQWCLVGGSYQQTGGLKDGSPFEATFASGTATASSLPGSFSGFGNAQALSVSCSWPGSCGIVVVAFGATSSVAVLENPSAGGWTATTVPLPANAGSPPEVTIGLEEIGNGAIDCVAGTCTTAGSYGNTSGKPIAFVSTYPNLNGYQEVASDGGLFAFGTPFYGSMGGQPLNEPVVAMAVVPDTGGYYEVASDGGIFAFNAPFFGSMGGQPLNASIVGIAFDPLTGGYYEVASDGGIFAFNAPFYGSMGGKPLNRPIVGIAFDPLTGGYYEVASDGGIFAFNAPFLGSTGNLTLNQPVVAMTVDTTTGGYYEVASDGGMFAYGSPFLGSMGGQPINEPVVGMAFDPFTNGYYEVASDGGLFSFGAPFLGSMGGQPLNASIVGIGVG